MGPKESSSSFFAKLLSTISIIGRNEKSSDCGALVRPTNKTERKEDSQSFHAIIENFLPVSPLLIGPGNGAEVLMMAPAVSRAPTVERLLKIQPVTLGWLKA